MPSSIVVLYVDYKDCFLIQEVQWLEEKNYFVSDV
jgi:hypothetical protein